MFQKHIHPLFSKNYPLLAVVSGFFLIAISLGPYETLDTELEYNTTRGVLRWGFPYLDRHGEPYTDSYGDLFNIPPLGFYTQALILKLFGANLANGVFLVTLFGLGIAVMIYKLGKLFYNESAGIFAAAFFALTPWALILTRALLVDTQCLLLSLIYLYIGILAIKNNSIKLTLISGVFFAASFLTKQYAVFMLIPLLLYYILNRPKNIKTICYQVVLFCLPFFIFNLLWYQLIMGQDLFYLVQHNDFKDCNFPNVIPTYSFVPYFLVNYGLGLFFCVAVALSLFITLFFWKRLPRHSTFSDLVCIVTILFMVGLVLYLAVNLNLKAPYTSSIKYLYQSLPFFSLLAGSLIIKSKILLETAKKAVHGIKSVLCCLGIAVLILLFFTVFSNMITIREFAQFTYLIFRVQPSLDVGYSFYVNTSMNGGVVMLIIQIVGFLLILSGLLLASQKSVSCFFKEKKKKTDNALSE